MPLRSLRFKPGIDREVSRYTAEGGWYDCDKVRFQKGLPEKIGGWRRTSNNTFLGICRSLHVWNNNGGAEYLGVGTNLKFYVEFGGAFFDITPIRATSTAGAVTFTATTGSTTLLVTDTAHGAKQDDFVTFSGAVGLGGNVAASVLNREYQITRIVNDNSYEVTLSIPALVTDTGNGGASTSAEYQINTGPEIVVSVQGYGAGAWGQGAWGIGETSQDRLRLWNQDNYGEDLFLGPSGGPLYYWKVSDGVLTRAVPVSSLIGASDVPLFQNNLLVSDIFRFAFVFGTNDIGSSAMDAMLIRWSDQEDITDWRPRATNQAGSLRLSRGSEIITAIQARQELLVYTDSALYSLQYLGAPIVWGAQLIGANTSIVGPNAVTFANGVAFWMGKDGFYQYDGRLQPLMCSLLDYIFSDINREQYRQVFAGTVEAFNEIWFFYCSADSEQINRYVVYDYVENDWVYGTLNRTAWLDTTLRDYPLAATYSNNIVEHEVGTDDNETATPAPITAFVQSGDFDLDDGDRVMFVWRCLPDVQFIGSTTGNPEVTLSFFPRYSAGGPQVNPASVGSVSSGEVVRSAVVPVTQFTEQLNTRVRGRHMAFRIESNALGVQWKLGTPRIDMRPDGRR